VHYTVQVGIILRHGQGEDRCGERFRGCIDEFCIVHYVHVIAVEFSASGDFVVSGNVDVNQSKETGGARQCENRDDKGTRRDGLKMETGTTCSESGSINGSTTAR
jgi:hypothetical protein